MSKHKTTNSTGASNLVKRPAAPAVVAFIDAIEAENRNSPGKAWSRVSVETIMEFVDAAQNYYESGVRAAAACRNALVGALQAVPSSAPVSTVSFPTSADVGMSVATIATSTLAGERVMPSPVTK